VKQFKSATETEISSYNSKKRTVTQRFAVMFGKHKATNDTMHAYDEVITLLFVLREILNGRIYCLLARECL
jgi:hypothetical protein